jgi:hypothetical protein
VPFGEAEDLAGDVRVAAEDARASLALRSNEPPRTTREWVSPAFRFARS